jgi:hypothetical protein
MNKDEKLTDLYNYFWWAKDKIGNKIEINNDVLKNVKNKEYRIPMMLNILTAMNWIVDNVNLKTSKIILEKGENRELYISVIYDSGVTSDLSAEYMVYKNNVSFRCLLD